MNPDATTPRAIDQADATHLRIVWGDGHESVYAVADLRRSCRCAVCVDEWTGKRRVEPRAIPDTVRPKAVKPVGRYAIHFDWDDGHSSGIYTFEHLRSLCPCSECRKAVADG